MIFGIKPEVNWGNNRVELKVKLVSNPVDGDAVGKAGYRCMVTGFPPNKALLSENPAIDCESDLVDG